MNKFITILIASASLCLSSLAIAVSSVEERSLQSDILNENRSFSVYLPSNYDKNNAKKFSVLYMLDAGNDDALVAQQADKLANEAGKQAPIVVAIANIRRGYDFTPSYLKLGRGNNRRDGNGDNFLSFITKELIPKIEQEYSVNDTRYFMGHSWGGAFSSYVLSQNPDLFKGFFIFSPSFGNIPNVSNKDDKLSQDFIKNIKQNKSLHFVYVSVGGKERQRFKNSFDGFKPFLESQLPQHIRLVTAVNDDVDHLANPEVSIPNALKLVFK
ncbi:MAG: alpha/beta hydrolase [Psychrobium sp.]